MVEEGLARRLQTLEKLGARGAKMFALREGPAEHPVMAWDVAGIPPEWITTGTYRWDRRFDDPPVALPTR